MSNPKEKAEKGEVLMFSMYLKFEVVPTFYLEEFFTDFMKQINWWGKYTERLSASISCEYPLTPIVESNGITKRAIFNVCNPYDGADRWAFKLDKSKEEEIPTSASYRTEYARLVSDVIAPIYQIYVNNEMRALTNDEENFKKSYRQTSKSVVRFERGYFTMDDDEQVHYRLELHSKWWATMMGKCDYYMAISSDNKDTLCNHFKWLNHVGAFDRFLCYSLTPQRMTEVWKLIPNKK